MRAFRIGERDLPGGCREIRLEGELDLSVADGFQDRLDAAVAEGLDVLVCLHDCDFIDSTGIAVLVSAHKLLAAKERRLTVCHPTVEVGRILTLTGLTEQGIVFEGAGDALAERFGHGVSRPLGAEQSPQELSAPDTGSR